MKSLIRLSLLLITCSTLQAQTTLNGTAWDGAIRIMGIELTIAVKFHTPAETPAATIDIPQQSAMGLPLTNISQELPRVHFELKAGPGLAVFEGTLQADSITGIFTQASQMGTFYLRPHKESKSEAKVEEPVPYKQDEVKFNNGGITLAGTLTLPPTSGKHPAVVMITGSGSQNRDEDIFGFKLFKIIADALTRKGVAVLRSDDRGVGGSGGGTAESTTGDFAMDALSGVQYLRSRKDIDPNHIGLCGHSEGALAASIAADKSHDVAFIVLLAGPGVPGDTLILWQQVTLMRASGASDSDINEAAALQHRVYDAVRTDSGWDQIRSSLSERIAHSLGKLTPDQRKALGDSASFVASRTDATLRDVRRPWFKYFIMYDPAPTLRRIKCPVLALFGELDMQVPPAVAMKPLEAALNEGGNTDVTVRVLPKANHLFQAAVTGLPSEYGSLKKEFVPGFLDTLSTWVTKRVEMQPQGR